MLFKKYKKFISIAVASAILMSGCSASGEVEVSKKGQKCEKIN